MPYLDIRLAADAFDASASRQLALTGTQLAHTVLGKRPEVTAVSINRFSLESWMTGLHPQLEQRKPAAYAELTITAGTNSATEKAAFIAQMSDALKQALPDLSAVSYVVVREVEATNWGYDGMTQAARREQSLAPVTAKHLPSEALDMAFYEQQAHRLRSQAIASWLKDSLSRLFKIWKESVGKVRIAGNA